MQISRVLNIISLDFYYLRNVPFLFLSLKDKQLAGIIFFDRFYNQNSKGQKMSFNYVGSSSTCASLIVMYKELKGS